MKTAIMIIIIIIMAIFTDMSLKSIHIAQNMKDKQANIMRVWTHDHDVNGNHVK